MKNSVEISSGKVRGIRQAGVDVFKGIPYADNTSGDRRFRPPAPPRPWPGVYEARDFGPASPQLSPAQVAVVNPARQRAAARLRGDGEQVPFIEARQGEDCLVLNVWTPGLDDGKRPVLVWLHGGGWVAGSASQPLDDGANMARLGNVVVVSANHRLGLVGYLNLAELGGEEYSASGYVGALDIVAVLRWVHDHIATFGGDPTNVTIFGQSGGGEKVAAMLACPDANGLFQKGIMQSSLGATHFTTVEDSLRLADEAMALLGITRVEEFAAQPLERLIETQLVLARRALSRAEHTLTAVPRSQFHEMLLFSPTWPVGDAARSFTVEAGAKCAPGVPLMIGSTRDETAFEQLSFLRAAREDGALDSDSVPAALVRFLGPEADRILADYRSAMPDADLEGLLIAITSDHAFSIPAVRYAEHRSAAREADVYMYLFEWGVPFFGPKRRAPHCIELPFVFHNLEASPFWHETDSSAGRIGREQMAAQVNTAWTSFARDGVPSHHDLPRWPPFTAGDRSTMVFGEPCRLEDDPLRLRRQAWDGLADSQLGLGSSNA